MDIIWISAAVFTAVIFIITFMKVCFNKKYLNMGPVVPKRKQEPDEDMNSSYDVFIDKE